MDSASVICSAEIKNGPAFKFFVCFEVADLVSVPEITISISSNDLESLIIQWTGMPCPTRA